MPLENTEAIHIQIIIQMLIKSQNSCRISQHKKSRDSHLIMQKLGKFSFKISFKPSGLQK